MGNKNEYRLRFGNKNKHGFFCSSLNLHYICKDILFVSMKKINILTIALLGYLLIMSFIGWPGRNNSLSYPEYFAVIGGSVVVIFLLRYLRVRIFKMRNKQNERE